MGMVFGKNGVAEPAYKVLVTKPNGTILPYEIRRYGERLAAETSYNTNNNNNGDDGSSPFRLLAGYIGVFGSPQNEGACAISMTAPVSTTTTDPTTTIGPVPIAMTAPVVMTTTTSSAANQKRKTMMFYLPVEYTSLASVPKPTNPAVTLRSIPPRTGAVHRFSGSMDEARANEVALQLAHQLREDGIVTSSPLGSKLADDDYVLSNKEAWGYDPPFTLPPFRRNEVWIPLTAEEVAHIVLNNKPSVAEMN